MQSIPVINISPGAGDADTVDQVERACRDVGFIYVAGHGIAREKIDRMRQTVIDYFSRPLDDKNRDRITRKNYRGYIPQGFFSPNDGSSAADRYEGYKLHFEVSEDHPIVKSCDLYGPNKWPPAPAGFRAAVLDYWRACDDVAHVLLEILARILGVNAGSFLQHFDTPLTNMTLLHYPPQDPAESGFGIHPHKDTDALTILVADEVGGLMVRPRDGAAWLEIEPPDDTLVVNIGDLLELWSGGYFVSTPHKVVNKSGAERYSFPFFVVPRYDTVVRPLRAPAPGFARKSVHVGDVSREVWRTNWPDTVPASAEFDLGTLQD